MRYHVYNSKVPSEEEIRKGMSVEILKRNVICGMRVFIVVIVAGKYVAFIYYIFLR